jgi:hypothetical protein
MECEYDHEPRDVEAWWHYHTHHSSPHRLNYWLGVALIAGGGAWVGTRIGLTQGTRIALGFVGLLAGWALAAAVARAWIHVSVVAMSKSQASQHQFGRHRLTLGADGIREQGPSAVHTHSWSTVEGLGETADHLFLAVGGGFAYAIPKRALAPGDVAAVRASVATYLGRGGAVGQGVGADKPQQ